MGQYLVFSSQSFNHPANTVERWFSSEGFLNQHYSVFFCLSKPDSSLFFSLCISCIISKCYLNLVGKDVSKGEKKMLVWWIYAAISQGLKSNKNPVSWPSSSLKDREFIHLSVCWVGRLQIFYVMPNWLCRFIRNCGAESQPSKGRWIVTYLLT